MTPAFTRRRFLAVSAAAFSVAGSTPAAAAAATWRGTALGAAAKMRLAGVTAAAARPVFQAVERELFRLEAVFSLYRPGSELLRLNATGRIDAPSPDLLAVLSTADRLFHGTDGAFDPTVQPLFAAHARAAAAGQVPSRQELAAARALVGWKALHFGTAAVQFNRPGMALTLNGIAQGYITDRIAALLRGHGLTDILVDMGEIAALGQGPGGQPWRAGIADTDGRVLRRLTLQDRALATSAPQGTVLDPAGKLGHIYDPGTGDVASAAALVSVSAPRAEMADGLSTALCALPADRRVQVIAAFPGARLEIAI